MNSVEIFFAYKNFSRFPSKLNRCEPIEVWKCVSNLGHHLTPISFQPRGVTLREELAKVISAFKI